MAGIISDEERRRILAQMLSGQLMRPPPPIQATPATPLPGVPLQTPVVAPQSEQAVAQPFDEFASVRAALGQQRPVTLTGNAQIDAILQSRQATQQAGAKTLMDILSAARMNPEEQAIIAERRARNQKELEQLDADKKRAGWEALARAGFKMAQSNSPYFMQALASGMEAGVEGLNESKLKREEKRSRLQAAEEDARLAEIRGKQSAQDRALSIYNAALAAGKSEAEAERLARKDAEELATLPQRMKLADLEVTGKEADIAYTKARTVDALRPPSSGGGGGGGREPNPPSATSVLEEGGKFTREIPELREAARSSFYAYQKEKDPAKKAELKGKYEIARDNYRRVRDRLAKIEGRQPGSPFRRSVTGEIYTGPQRTTSRGAAKPASGGLPADVAKKYGL